MTAKPQPANRPSPAVSYIPPETHLRELTVRAVVMGTLLGVIFGASSLYLVLKVGLTVSASIPVAVISLTLFRLWSRFGGRDATILENNIVQTAGSAGESIAFGLGVTMPAIMILGFDLEITRVMLVGLLGGLLGILMMIPLRRALIVAQHGQLKYPEGTACAEVLKAGACAESRAAARQFEQGAGFRTDLPHHVGEPLNVPELTSGRASPSPSPQPSPLGRGSPESPPLDQPKRADLSRRGDRFPLSPRERAGVRGNKADVNPTGSGVPSPPRSRAGDIGAGTIFTGFGVGLAYKALMSAFRLWKDVPEKIFGPPLKAGSLSAEISPELLGVGYIIGPKISCIMAAGGVLSSMVLIPLIKFFGEGLTTVLAPGTKLIADMTPDQIRGQYVLYIGAGAVAAGGVISLVRSLPIILHGLRSGVADFRSAAVAHASVLRTDRDLSMKFVVGGSVALILAILAVPSLHMNLLGAVLIVVFGFLFATVSSRLTGEIGSSSNPISGMTVATLLLTCLVFLIVGWTGGTYYVTALSVGGIVCVAASNAGTTSQDLKTGYLIGATPKHQQVAILIGAAASALLLGPILLSLNNTATVYVPIAQIAPGLHAPASAQIAGPEKLRGPQAKDDANTYRVWQKTDIIGAPAGKYLVDEQGAAVWLVDPGINGAHKTRPDGTEVRKFAAPKATLMSYIIKGMLDRKLPWGLVLFGIMIAVVLELCGLSSLAFAVGVYLPVSASTPILVGGLVRWLVDRRMRRNLREHQLDEAELVAESDKSPGVLLASGFIAGGAITGILIALMTGVLDKTDAALTGWAEAHNPFFAGPSADWLALLPFVGLTVFLYVVGRRETTTGKFVD
jgi:OPT family oligopeptide transporter